MKPLYYSTNILDVSAQKRYLLTDELQMEHAAIAMMERVCQNAKDGATVLIVCGSGNNGADGYALARLLHGKYCVKILEHEPPKSPLAILQANRAHTLEIEFTKMPNIGADVIVDAIFGSGFKGTLSAKTIGLIQKLNAIKAFKIACDIPTGLFGSGKIDVITLIADETVSMGADKLALFSDMAKPFVGKIIGANLGVSYDKFTKDFTPDAIVLEVCDMRLPVRNNPNTHKGDFGFVCVMAGQKSGAAILAALSATRFGAGLVGIVGEKNIPPQIIQLNEIPKNATLVAGCGLGKANNMIFDKLLASNSCVIDADLFYDNNVCLLLEKEFVLTPHPKEFVSLLSICEFGNFSIEDIQNNRFEFARDFSLKYPNIVLLLKGANSIIAKEGAIYIMPFGSQILSKGGSGDVLCGMIAALLAQNYKALDATITASIAHALSAMKFCGSNYALMPQDIIDNLKNIDNFEAMCCEIN
jgi:hydroxyethylthiazole kinase-like uncharacterized protein yjeF